jgi:hypothetical protein
MQPWARGPGGDHRGIIADPETVPRRDLADD